MNAPNQIKKIKRILSLPALLFISVFSLLAYHTDDDQFTLLLAKLSAYNEKFPQEKLHLHLDKPYYAAGDDIWFKAYLINTRTSTPSAISGIMYVELINEKNKLESRLKLPVISGVSWGDFKLPDTLQEGNYRIRAYTNWMRNAGPEFFFDKTISIGNLKIAGKLFKAVSRKNAVDVQFFAEGGNLVEGITNKLGIKAVNTTGLGEDISGTIIDNSGSEVTKFKTTHLGMGNVTINPQPGKSYKAKVSFKDGTENIIDLPRVSKSGYVISASQDETDIYVKVHITADLMNKGEFKLVAQNNSNIYFVCKAADNQQMVNIPIPKKSLSSGIIQLTLFSADNLPVAERLVFVNNPIDKISTTISSAKKTYAAKEAVALELESVLNGKPVQGSFSVSVTNTTAVNPDEQNESNIFTSLLLTSDLTGYIEKPNYYFLKDDAQTRADLDNLLLTQGWRRVTWKNVISGINPPINFKPEKSLTISGSALTNGKKPAIGTAVSLIYLKGGMQLDTLTDLQGRFVFDDLVFKDSTRFMLQSNRKDGDKKLRLKLDELTEQIISGNKNIGDIKSGINAAMLDYLKQSEIYFNEELRGGRKQKSIALNEVKITAKKNVIKNSSNLNGGGNADAVITADQLKECFSISQCLERYGVAGMTFKNGLPYLIRNNGAAMMIVLDGVTIDSAGFMSISTANVQAVEVLKDLSKTAVYGAKGANSGVIIITSKRAGDDTYVSKPNPGMISVMSTGYAVSREFYAPNYALAGSAQVSDHRSTIYWNPNILTEDTGKATIKYFNADGKGIYRVVVEGFDMLGRLARSVYTYEVK